MPEDARKALDDNVGVLELFLTRYLLDSGIQLQLVAHFAREIELALLGDIPGDLVEEAISELELNKDSLDLELVIDAAPSLEFLVSIAKGINEEKPAVLPSEIIPSDEVVEAALQLFHENKKSEMDKASEEKPEETRDAA